MKTAFFAGIGLLVAGACLKSLGLDAPPHAPAPSRPTFVVASAATAATLTGDERRVTVKGRLSSTPARAVEDARKGLELVVAERLAEDGVPRSWRPSPRLLDGLVVRIDPATVKKDLGIKGAEQYETLHTATIQADLSDARLKPLFDEYGRTLLHRRLALLGGGLAFVLACLAALSGYIRADEATKGYYTNRLRVLAAGGVGAAGVVLYRLLA